MTTPNAVTDRERVLSVLTDEWVSTAEIHRKIRALGSKAKHPRVGELLWKLHRHDQAARQVGEDGPNGYRAKRWKRAT